MPKVIPFSDLEKSDLFVDDLFKGGTQHGNMRDEALSKLIPGCSNSGGFRIVRPKNDKNKIAYVVLYTTMSKIEWPDYLDRETGVFRYYGDNKTGGALLDTPKQGNRLLQNVFGLLNTGEFQKIPPFLIFCSGKGRDVQFLGLAAPGVPTLSPDRELVAFWRTLNNHRFQNYEAYFTVLDIGETPVLKQWLLERHEGRPEADRLAPNAWRKFQLEGRRGIRPLKTKVIDTYPNWFSQVQSNAEGTAALQEIRRRYSDADAYGFEACATDILLMADPNFTDFKLTRPWRDGGRDAIGYYQIQVPGTVNNSLRIDCALEAKCYTPTDKGGNGVGVHEMSRLISRIRYRQFGAMVTTSFIAKQAYDEVKEDGHPILLLTATNIATVLQQHGIHSIDDVNEWLDVLPEKYARM